MYSGDSAVPNSQQELVTAVGPELPKVSEGQKAWFADHSVRSPLASWSERTGESSHSKFNAFTNLLGSVCERLGVLY